MISVAIPTYNGEKYLREQLDSLYNQTLVPDEIVVVDDCSKDGTVSILEEYRNRYGLKYVINETNLGYNKNFEKAISLCTGDYIALCDQDDIWLPEKIQKAFDRISQFPLNEPSLVSSFSCTDKRILETPIPCGRKDGDWRMNFIEYESQGCTLMFNRALRDYILPFPEGIMYDGYIGFVAALIGNREYIGENLMYYRIHQNNSFQDNRRQSVLSTAKRNLLKYVPLWNPKARYDALNLVRSKFEKEAIQEHKKYLNNMMSLYETPALRRIPILWDIREIPIRIKLLCSALLFVKAVFQIPDKY